MTVLWDLTSATLCISGALFFVAGTIGLLRFPDVYTRLHALTKADNLGLGLISFSVAMQQPSWIVALKILLVWCIALVGSATVCNLIAASASEGKTQPWQTGEG